MKKRITTPQCDVCRKFYNQVDSDESGLCPECKPENIEPDLIISFQTELKRNLRGEVIEMEEWNEKIENQVFEEQDIIENQNQEENIINDIVELKIEDIIQPGVFGVSNKQMIPAIRQAVDEGSVEKLRLLKKAYFYTFDRTQRYLRKKDREFIKNNDI